MPDWFCDEPIGAGETFEIPRGADPDEQYHPKCLARSSYTPSDERIATALERIADNLENFPAPILVPGSSGRRVHHAQFDSGAIDLVGYLTGEQVAKVVLLAARFQGNGLEAARMRLVPSAYPERRAA